MSKPKKKNPPRVLLMTGLAGAGRSVFLKTLEDLGYETIDNLPLFFAEKIIFDDRADSRPLALSVDLRTRDFSVSALQSLLALLQKRGVKHDFIFLESDDNVIERRYQETRRHHPLDARTLVDSIKAERLLLDPLKKRAHHVIDTSLLTPIELKGCVRNLFGFESQRIVPFEVVSFSFMHGIPRAANLVFDMRFLKNPHYDPELRTLTGQDSTVQAYLSKMPLFRAFKDQLFIMLETILPSVEQEGRGMFVIAFGCSGGRHRSVAMAESVNLWLLEKGYRVQIQHRELMT